MNRNMNRLQVGKSSVLSIRVQSRSISVLLLSSGPATIAAESSGYFASSTSHRCLLGTWSKRHTAGENRVSMVCYRILYVQLQLIESAPGVEMSLLLTCTCWRAVAHRGEIDVRLTSPWRKKVEAAARHNPAHLDCTQVWSRTLQWIVAQEGQRAVTIACEETDVTSSDEGRSASHLDAKKLLCELIFR